MAILSTSVLVSSLSLVHLTVAFFLLYSPTNVTRHGLVYVLSGAFELAVPTELDTPSTATTWLACLFAFIGVTDFISANVAEEIGVVIWGAQAPLRTFFFMLLAGWGWLSGPKGMQMLRAGDAVAGNAAPGVVSDGLVFSWAFLELIFWFWVFLTARDERRALIVKQSINRD